MVGMDTIAGGAGTMWTTALQIGQLVETAHLVRLFFVTQLGKRGIEHELIFFLLLFLKVYNPTEVRIVVTHASPGREGLLAQLALMLKVRMRRIKEDGEMRFQEPSLLTLCEIG